MKAVMFATYGGPEVLELVDTDEPHPGPGQVRIAVRAVGVNPADWKIRSGAVAEAIPLDLPAIIGLEAAGVVDELGEGVDDVAVGDEVFGSAVGGATAELAILGPRAVKPAGVSWEVAAGLPVAAETAVRMFNDLGGVGVGDTILVDGATGGVGTTAVQLAVARGARVIGTASAPNQDYLRSLGAEPTTYDAGLADRVRALAPDGVDLALDCSGHNLPVLIELVGADRVVTIVDMGAAALGVKISTGAGPRAYEGLGEAAAMAADGRFQLPIARTFDFSEAAEAHRVSEDGHTRGKLILLPG
jgi:NADPH:quinone reductase-like Zn-dependent oxidoreductase